LNDLCSYSVIQLLLSNGILFKSEIFSKKIREDFIETLYEKIYNVNSLFVTDDRFIDFNSIEIAISIISFSNSQYKYNTSKTYNNKIYAMKNKNNLFACYIVIER
jgi:hypothetical protein